MFTEFLSFYFKYNTETVPIQYAILFIAEGEESSSSREAGVNSCITHPLFLITVGVLAVLLLVSLITLTVCIIRLTHANTK